MSADPGPQNLPGSGRGSPGAPVPEPPPRPDLPPPVSFGSELFRDGAPGEAGSGEWVPGEGARVGRRGIIGTGSWLPG